MVDTDSPGGFLKTGTIRGYCKNLKNQYNRCLFYNFKGGFSRKVPNLSPFLPKTEAARVMSNILTWVWTCVLSLAATSLFGAIPPEIRVVALTGESAPGTAAQDFSSFVYQLPPVVGGGEIAFAAKFGTTGEGIWRDRAGEITPIVLSGQEVQDIPGATFSQFSEPAINGSADIAFRAVFNTQAPGALAGIWSLHGDNLANVAMVGHNAPGTTAPFDTLDPPLINSAGHTAFFARLSTGSTTDRSGIWAEGFGPGLSLVVREADPAPGTGGTFDDLFHELAFADGTLAFTAMVDGDDLAGDNAWGVWKQTANGLSFVARQGQPAPGATGGVFDSFGDPVVNDRGHVAFRGRLAGVASGIYRDTGGGLTDVASTDSLAPGTGGRQFSTFSDPAINRAGRVAFSANLRDAGPGEGTNGVWSDGRGTRLALVAFEGDPAPGTSSAFSSFDDVVLNDTGQVAFSAQLQDAPLIADKGIWVQDKLGDLVPVVVEGQEFAVIPGVLKTVEQLSFAQDVGFSDSRQMTFSGEGELLFRLKFDDGSEGLFVAIVAVPEPGTLATALICVLCLAGRCAWHRRSCSDA